MDAFKNGIIDRQEVLKKTEIFDMEGVMERTDIIQQLQSQLEGATEQIKQLKGDLQTRDREAVNLRKKVEVEKFKSDLDGTSNKAKAASTLFEKRLNDEMSVLKRDIAIATKPDSTPSDKRSQKKEN